MHWLLATLTLLFAFAASPVLAEKRVALVIGNDSYPNLPTANQLQRAVADARAVRDVLTGLGFDVSYDENVGLGPAKQLFFDFSSKLVEGDIAFVFYAGHGVALRGANYLLPSDIPTIRRPETEAALKEEEERLAEFAIPEAFIIQRIKAKGARVGIVVLDACRDNPLKVVEAENPFRSIRPGDLVFGARRGLARVESMPEGIFSIYSANFGQQAIDRLGPDDPSPNSPFTRIFLKHLATPGKGLRTVMVETREEVVSLARTIGVEQRPALYDEVVGGDLFLAGEAPDQSGADPAPPSDALAADYGLAAAVGTREAWDAFLKQHGRKDSFYVQLAEAALKKLTSSVVASLEEPTKQEPPTSISDDERTRFARAIQSELKRHRCDVGAIDGRWGDSSRRAARDFIRFASLSMEPEPTAKLLNQLKSRTEPLCLVKARPESRQRPTKSDPARSTKPRAVKGLPTEGSSTSQTVGASCRLESLEECRHRVCPRGGCGLRGSGICRGNRRKTICS